ncbi:MAG TPA: VWA domain-containing protein [Polyangiaceae bacterium]|jgi:hypothetical protein
MNRLVPAALIVAGVVASCAARTGLPAPERSDAHAFDAGPDEPVGCTPGDIPLFAATPEVMFVLDRSGSMRSAFDGPHSRWQVLRDALAATLPPVDGKMAVGALLFPSGSSNADCTVAPQANLAPALGNVSALVSLMQANKPGGSTPTAAAIDVAAALLLDLRAASAARALVLATDGAPNCNPSLDPKTCDCPTGNGGSGNCHGDAERCLDDVRTVQRIAAAFAQGIPTYVVGIADAGDNTFSKALDAMAQAGGRPLVNAPTSYYPARSASDLDAALAAIRNQVGACTYLTTSVPDASGSIVVTLDGQTLPFAPDGGASGWSWADESNGEIMLDGATCTAAAADAGITLVAHVTCGEDAGADAEAGADADDASDADETSTDGAGD